MGDPLRVGVIGTGDEGNVLLGAITPSYIQVVAIADIRPYNIHRAFHGDHASENALKVRCGLMTKYGWTSEDEARKHVKVYDKTITICSRTRTSKRSSSRCRCTCTRRWPSKPWRPASTC